MEALFDKVYNVTQKCHVHYFQKTTATNRIIFENSMMASPAEVRSGITKSQVKMVGVKIELTGFLVG